MADSVAAHRSRVLATIAALAPLPPETVPVGEAQGRVTAADVVAPLSVPRFDNAAMDGYAVRAADLAGAVPISLPVAGVVAAGDAWAGPLTPGSALRIMTGAPMPDGADTVVPFEWTDRGADTVRVEQRPAAGRHVRRTGEDVVAGSVVVPAATQLRPPQLGLLAATGCREVLLRSRPRVAILATGAELVAGDVSPPVADALAPGHLPDSNSVAIAGAVRAAGGTPSRHGPAPDDPAAFLELLTEAAAAADLVVTTGGISAGDHDVVKAALGERHGMWFGSVAVKPGRPQGAGTVRTADGREVPSVCLPGTPVAAYTSFQLFAAPAIRALQGLAPRWLSCEEHQGPRLETSPLAASVDSSPDRTLVLPGRFDDVGRVTVLRGHAGHSQALLAAADALVVVPPGEPVAAGEAVDVVRL